jgi:hypothetical protein
LYIKRIVSPENRKGLLIFLGVVVLLIFIFKPTSEPGGIQENIIKINEGTSQSAPEAANLIGKNVSEAETVFGDLLNTSQISQELKSQKFAAGRTYDPVEVVTDNAGLIKAALEPTLDLKTGDLEKLKVEQKLPDPDFEMYTLGDYMVKVYVFLSRGVAYEASEFGGQIFRKIYFAPTDKAGFLSMFPNRYSEKYVPNQY